MHRPDVTIIGAGIFGLSIAWFCAKRGMAVHVLEKRQIGAGASGGLIGALSPHMPEKWNAKKAFQLDALMNAQGFWQDVGSVSGLPTGYGRIGRIMPIANEHGRTIAQDRIGQARDLWPDTVNWTVLDDFPGLAASKFGVVHETLSARINPQQAILSLAEACRKAGVRITENTTDPRPADLTIIASGYEAAPHLPDGFLTGVKGQSALLDSVLPDLPIVFFNGVYVVNQGKIGTAVGSTSEKSWTDPATTDTQLDAVIERAKSLYPKLANAQVKARWAGIRPRASLPDPVVGQIAPKTFIATGGFKIGLALGPEIGKALAAHIDGAQLDLPASLQLTHQLTR